MDVLHIKANLPLDQMLKAGDKHTGGGGDSSFDRTLAVHHDDLSPFPRTHVQSEKAGLGGECLQSELLGRGWGANTGRTLRSLPNQASLLGESQAKERLCLK